MKREDEIRTAIEHMSGSDFQGFAVELLSRTLYPGLNPSTPSHDLGEDARSENTTLFLNVEHQGKRVSVAVSKIGGRPKLWNDCKRCKATGRNIDVLVFVTPEDVRTDVEERWRRAVHDEFGWELELRTARWLVPVATRPEHDGLVDEYLQIPPLGGDHVHNIDEALMQQTERVLRHITPEIPGLSASIPREEIQRIEDQFSDAKSVLLTGEAGTGKSGIVYRVVRAARERGGAVLLVDARDCGHVHSQSELRQDLELHGPLVKALGRIGRCKKGALLVIDQLDSATGLDSARVLVDLACQVRDQRVTVLAASRRTEAHEESLVRDLIEAGFVEVPSHPLKPERAEDLLRMLGIVGPPSELVRLAQNLLNLELIARIREQQPNFSFSTIINEVELWEQYIITLCERERVAAEPRIAEEMLAEAAALARMGLNEADRSFRLREPYSRVQMRLESWQVIVRDEGVVFRFRHDKLQDFLYARDAVDRCLMPIGVAAEIAPYRARTIFPWMTKLYQRRGSRHYVPFLEEVFYGQR